MARRLSSRKPIARVINLKFTFAYHVRLITVVLLFTHTFTIWVRSLNY